MVPATLRPRQPPRRAAKGGTRASSPRAAPSAGAASASARTWPSIAEPTWASVPSPAPAAARPSSSAPRWSSTSACTPASSPTAARSAPRTSAAVHTSPATSAPMDLGPPLPPTLTGGTAQSWVARPWTSRGPCPSLPRVVPPALAASSATTRPQGLSLLLPGQVEPPAKVTQDLPPLWGSARPLSFPFPLALVLRPSAAADPLCFLALCILFLSFFLPSPLAALFASPE